MNVDNIAIRHYNMVKLNVGGIVYFTSKATLKKEDNRLSAMSLHSKAEDGSIFIDRDGKHFGTILNFLRDGHVHLPTTEDELCKLKMEAEYYGIKELSKRCQICGPCSGILAQRNFKPAFQNKK